MTDMDDVRLGDIVNALRIYDMTEDRTDGDE